MKLVYFIPSAIFTLLKVLTKEIITAIVSVIFFIILVIMKVIGRHIFELTFAASGLLIAIQIYNPQSNAVYLLPFVFIYALLHIYILIALEKKAQETIEKVDLKTGIKQTLIFICVLMMFVIVQRSQYYQAPEYKLEKQVKEPVILEQPAENSPNLFEEKPEAGTEHSTKKNTAEVKKQQQKLAENKLRKEIQPPQLAQLKKNKSSKEYKIALELISFLPNNIQITDVIENSNSWRINVKISESKEAKQALDKALEKIHASSEFALIKINDGNSLTNYDLINSAIPGLNDSDEWIKTPDYTVSELTLEQKSNEPNLYNFKVRLK